MTAGFLDCAGIGQRKPSFVTCTLQHSEFFFFHMSELVSRLGSEGIVNPRAETVKGPTVSDWWCWGFNP